MNEWRAVTAFLLAPVFLLGAGAAFAQKASMASHSTVAKEQVATRRIVRGTEVQVSQNENFAHVETMLSVNPADPRHLLASCIILPKKNTGEFLHRSRA